MPIVAMPRDAKNAAMLGWIWWRVPDAPAITTGQPVAGLVPDGR
jgi:hypothetical protein